MASAPRRKRVSARASVKSEARQARDRSRLRAIATRIGVGVLAAILLSVALLVGDSTYHATAIGWLPFLGLMFLVALSLVYLVIVKHGLSFAETVPEGDILRGDAAAFRLSVKNNTPLPVFWLEVVFYLDDLYGNRSRESRSTLSLKPFESYEYTFNVTFDHIGCHRAGFSHAQVRDFLGLASRKQALAGSRTVRVSPQTYQLGGIDLTDRHASDDAQTARAILADSLDYAQVRPYEPGDPLKLIHWKLSARSDEFLTRMFEVHLNPTLAIILDVYCPIDDAEDLMTARDALVESAVSVAKCAQKLGIEACIYFTSRNGERKRTLLASATDLDNLVDDLPPLAPDEGLKTQALALLRDAAAQSFNAGALVLCTADLARDTLGSMVEAKFTDRDAYVLAVVPESLVDREREDYCANLGALSRAAVGQRAFTHAEELTGAVISA